MQMDEGDDVDGDDEGERVKVMIMTMTAKTSLAQSYLDFEINYLSNSKSFIINPFLSLN